jgi:hypothetical protein
MIKEGYPLARARQAALDELERRSGAHAPGAAVITADERDKLRRAIGDSLILRAGGRFAQGQSPAPGAEDFRGYTLSELARECLRRSRQPLTGHRLEIAGRAIATTDLPNLLVETSQRFLLEGWQYAEETWPLWTDEGSAPNFKKSEIIDFAVDNRLQEKKEGEEYKYGQTAEAKEEYRIVTYGKKFAITREAIINDDLDALTRIPMLMGEGVKRLIGDEVYAEMVTNPAMGDGKPLFHADHKNLALNQGGAPNITNLAAAELLMSKQVDAFGQKLNLRPMFYLAPRALRAASEVFFNTLLIGTDQSPNQPNLTNIYANSYTRVYESRLDDDSETSRYLLARKNIGVRVFYLDGQKEPYMESKDGWDIDGVEYRIRMDVGVKAVSWRGLQKQTLVA